MISFLVFLLALGLCKASVDVSTRLVADNYNPNKTDLVFQTIMSISGLISSGGRLSTESMRLALNAIEKSQILSEYNVVIRLFDDKCIPASGVKSAAEFFRSANEDDSESVVPILIGPGCAGNVYTGQFAEHFNFIQLSMGSISAGDYKEKQLDDNYFVILPSFGIFYEAIPSLVESQGWKHVYVISESLSLWNPVEKVLFDNIGKKDLTLLGISKLPVVAGAFPAPSMYEMMLGEVVKSEARIFVVNSGLLMILACWLYRFGLFGPGFVFIVPMFGIFYPNSLIIYPWCKPEMLYEVMKCLLVYHNDFRLDLTPDVKDGFGITGRFFDDTMMSKLVNPHLQPGKWYYSRGMAYEYVAYACTTVASVESVLKKRGDTWGNWLTGNENFKNNASHLTDLIKNVITTTKYDGLISPSDSTNESIDVDSMGFYQIHYQDEDVIDLETIKPEHFALYKNGVITVNPKKLRWRTKDGKAPFDKMRHFEVEIPRKTLAVEVTLFAIVIIIALWNVIEIAIECTKLKRTSFISIDILCRTGVILLLVNGAFTFLKRNTALCQAILMCSLLGISIILVSMFVKLQIAYRMYRIGTKIGRKYNKIRKRNIAVKAPKKLEITDQLPTHLKVTVFLIAGLTWTVQAVLAAVWVSILGSVDSHAFYRRTEFSTDDQSTAYRYFSEICTWNVTTTVQQVVAAVLLISFLVSAIVSICAAISIPKYVSLPTLTAVYRTKWMAYVLTVMLLCGFVSVWAISSAGNLISMNISVEVFELVTGLVVTGIIGLSKPLK